MHDISRWSACWIVRRKSTTSSSSGVSSHTLPSSSGCCRSSNISCLACAHALLLRCAQGGAGRQRKGGDGAHQRGLAAALGSRTRRRRRRRPRAPLPGRVVHRRDPPALRRVWPLPTCSAGRWLVTGRARPAGGCAGRLRPRRSARMRLHRAAHLRPRSIAGMLARTSEGSCDDTLAQVCLLGDHVSAHGTRASPRRNDIPRILDRRYGYAAPQPPAAASPRLIAYAKRRGSTWTSSALAWPRSTLLRLTPPSR